MARKRILNAQQRSAQRGREERPGPVEFSDRYVGPQTRVRLESERGVGPQTSQRISGRETQAVAKREAAPQSARAVAPRQAAVTKSDGQREAVTSQRLATQRVTLPTAERPSATPSERARARQPESVAAESATRAVGVTQRAPLREVFARGALIEGPIRRVGSRG